MVYRRAFFSENDFIRGVGSCDIPIKNKVYYIVLWVNGNGKRAIHGICLYLF